MAPAPLSFVDVDVDEAVLLEGWECVKLLESAVVVLLEICKELWLCVELEEAIASKPVARDNDRLLEWVLLYSEATDKELATLAAEADAADAERTETEDTDAADTLEADAKWAMWSEYDAADTGAKDADNTDAADAEETERAETKEASFIGSRF